LGEEQNTRIVNNPESNTEDSNLDFSVVIGNDDDKNDSEDIVLPGVSESDEENSDDSHNSNRFRNGRGIKQKNKTSVCTNFM
jgi:hypothetical protein